MRQARYAASQRLSVFFHPTDVSICDVITRTCVVTSVRPAVIGRVVGERLALFVLKGKHGPRCFLKHWINVSIDRLKWRSMLRQKAGNKLTSLHTTSLIKANQKIKCFVYRWLRALAMFDVTRIPAFVGVSSFQAFCPYVNWRWYDASYSTYTRCYIHKASKGKNWS